MMLNNAQHTMTRTAVHFYLLAFFLTIFFVTPRSTQAIGDAGDTLPSFEDFSQAVLNGEANVLRGVYVPEVLALPVLQQPANQSYFVSSRQGVVTQFSMAAQQGTVGLLAHNTLSGKLFSKLSVGQRVRLVYGDGRTETFDIAYVMRYQATKPDSVSSSFRNLDRTETLSASELFSRAYGGERHLVFQTCIEANGKASWGRLFVVALPSE